ncbi:MAG: DUF6148 family protein [Clostridiales bacterium]|nr:DUF6148 family protein [Eubacterium sp.]MDD7349737.1 DUF6148 family protein [Clostridiales bacterium]
MRDRQKRLERYMKQREMYLKAEEAVLTSQSYTIGTRTLSRADLAEIRKGIEYLDKKIDEIESSGGKRRAFRVIPRDL